MKIIGKIVRIAFADKLTPGDVGRPFEDYYIDDIRYEGGFVILTFDRERSGLANPTEVAYPSHVIDHIAVSHITAEVSGGDL